MRKLFFAILMAVAALYLFLMAVMYFFQERLIFFPEKLSENHSFTFPVPFEEVWIQSEGVRLHSLRFTKPEPKGVILFFHGNAGSLDSWGGLYQDFQRFPYDLWILDYRGYGKSGGEIRSEAALHQDAQAFYAAARARYKGKELIIYGRSIGTGIAAKLAAEHPPKLLFLETPYYSFPKLVQSIYPFVPSFLVKYKLETHRYVQNQDYPIHLFHGDQDALIPHDCAKDLEAIASNITLHTIEGAGHNNISAFTGYHQQLNTILPRQ